MWEGERSGGTGAGSAIAQVPSAPWTKRSGGYLLAASDWARGDGGRCIEARHGIAAARLAAARVLLLYCSCAAVAPAAHR